MKEMKNLIKLESPELSSIEKSKAEKIKKTFDPMVKMLEEFESAYNNVILESKKGIDEKLTARARRLRLDIGKVRITTEHARKSEKEEYLRAGKAIDGVSNILKWAITEKENNLKEIEDHFEIVEKQRLETLQREREDLLIDYMDNPDEVNLSSMEQDVFEAYLDTKKRQHQELIEAEKKAEEERIAKEKAEAEERERIAKENAKLKKEAEEREKQQQKEREEHERQMEAERKKREAERKKELEEKEADRKKQEAIRKEYEDKLAKEAEERRKVEAERKRIEREIQEEKDRKELEEKQRKEAELKKGDAEKMKDLVSELEGIRSKYTFKSKQNKEMFSALDGLIERFITKANSI